MSSEVEIEQSFECKHCNAKFASPLYGIDQTHEYVIYGEEPLAPEVEINDSQTIAGCCSTECRDQVREGVLKNLGVPVLDEDKRPGVEPIEACAICGGDVEMAKPHLTFMESDLEFGGNGGTVLYLEYLAVVCQACEPTIHSKSVVA